MRAAKLIPVLVLVIANPIALADPTATPKRALPMQAPVVKVTCEFLEITATTGKDPAADPELKPVEKKLNKQPWKYNQYKLLSRVSKSLEKGKTEAITLKQGAATAKLVETVDKAKARLTITEDHAGKQVIDNTFSIAAKDWWIAGHPVPPNNDGHLLAVSCQ
jgi:hypothetical protein